MDSTITIVKTNVLFFNNFLCEYEAYLDDKKVISFRIKEEEYRPMFYIIQGITRNNHHPVYIYTPGTHQVTIYDENYYEGKKYNLVTKNEDQNGSINKPDVFPRDNCTSYLQY